MGTRGICGAAAVLMAALAGWGCQAGPDDGLAQPGGEGAAEYAEQRLEATAAVERVEGVREAAIQVGLDAAGERPATLAVLIEMEGGHTPDARIGQAVVEAVLPPFPDVPPSNVSVQSPDEPGFLYLGDLGMME